MPTHIPRLLKLAGPMILSASSITIMQIIDAIILSRHSSASVAAIGPSGMAVILFQGFMFGTAGYAGTFVAHNHGRGNARGVRQSAWLGIHAALNIPACWGLFSPGPWQSCSSWPDTSRWSLATRAIIS